MSGYNDSGPVWINTTSTTANEQILRATGDRDGGTLIPAFTREDVQTDHEARLQKALDNLDPEEVAEILREAGWAVTPPDSSELPR